MKEIFSPNNSNEKELLRIYLKEIIKKKGKIQVLTHSTLNIKNGNDISIQ